jgi:hypothetical protein
LFFSARSSYNQAILRAKASNHGRPRHNSIVVARWRHLSNLSARAVSRSGDAYAYERATNDQRLLIALNFASRPAMIDIDGAWQLCLSSAERGKSKFNGTLTLAANEAVILESS